MIVRTRLVFVTLGRCLLLSSFQECGFMRQGDLSRLGLPPGFRIPRQPPGKNEGRFLCPPELRLYCRLYYTAIHDCIASSVYSSNNPRPEKLGPGIIFSRRFIEHTGILVSFFPPLPSSLGYLSSGFIIKYVWSFKFG